LTSDAQTQINSKATLDASPTFTGTVTATAFSGDGSGLTGVDSLPSQTGESGKYLTTDGTDASWAVVEALPDQSGNAGNYLTTDGTDASWAALEVGTATMTASGNIAAGDPVAVNSDGTISKIATTTDNANGWLYGQQTYDTIPVVQNREQGQMGGGGYAISSSYKNYFVTYQAVQRVGANTDTSVRTVCLWKLVDGKLILCDTIQAAFDYPNGASVDLSYDGKYAACSSFRSGSGGDGLAVYKIVNESFTLIYLQTSNSGHWYGVKFSDTSYDLMVIRDNGSSFFQIERRVKSGDSWIASGTQTISTTTSGNGNKRIERVPNTSKIVVSFVDEANGSRPTAFVYDVGNNTVGSKYTFSTNAQQRNWGGLVSMGDGNFYIMWFQTGSTYIRKFSVSGNNLSLSTQLSNTTNINFEYPLMMQAHRKTKKITIQYYETSTYNLNSWVYDASSTLTRIATETVQQDDTSNYFSNNDNTYNSTSFSGFEDTDLSVTTNYKDSLAWILFDPLRINSTNVENFIGFSTESISNGSSGVIKLKGNIHETTGLSAGETYYIDKDGSISTQPQMAKIKTKIGKALSTTKLLLEA
jgi:hypothetical protein